MTTLTVRTWLDSGANSQSCYKTEFEIDADEWASMTDKEKDEYAKEIAWDRMDWGWHIEGEST